MQKNLQTLMRKEMTRKEFLTTVGLAVISLFGFSSILKLLFGNKNLLNEKNSAGYGSSPYGGGKE